MVDYVLINNWHARQLLMGGGGLGILVKDLHKNVFECIGKFLAE